MSCLAKDWSDPAISAKYQSARAETTKHAEALRKAVAAKHVDMIAAETWWLLSDPAPKTYFALKLGRSRKVKSKSPSWCLKQASELDLSSHSAEKADAILRKKLNGSHRVILNFRLQRRIAQNIVRLVLAAHHRPRPFQFTHKGVPKAIQRVIVIADQGNLWCAHLDIKKFYQTFLIEELLENAALGGLLPSKTLATFVLARRLDVCVRANDLKHFPHLSYATLLSEARRGIPTGSCASSIVAPMMVSRMLLAAAVENHLVNFEDDFLLLAPTKDELEKRIEALGSSVKTIPGGRFKLQQKSCGHLAETGAFFLGHSISRNGGSVRIRLTHTNRESLYLVLDELFKELPVGGPIEAFVEALLKHCARAYQYLESWRATFALCEDVAEEAEDAMLVIEQTLAGIGKSMNDIKFMIANPSFVTNVHFEVISGERGTLGHWDQGG